MNSSNNNENVLLPLHYLKTWHLCFHSSQPRTCHQVIGLQMAIITLNHYMADVKTVIFLSLENSEPSRRQKAWQTVSRYAEGVYSMMLHSRCHGSFRTDASPSLAKFGVREVCKGRRVWCSGRTSRRTSSFGRERCASQAETARTMAGCS